jgi:hypothetical protein
VVLRMGPPQPTLTGPSIFDILNPGAGENKDEPGPAGDVDPLPEAIADALDKANPKYRWGESEHADNCVGVVQAYELRRRGLDVQAGPTSRIMGVDPVAGALARSPVGISRIWGRSFTWIPKGEIVKAFERYGDGARGAVVVVWTTGGSHIFNVENVGGWVRFFDAQRQPAVTDASHYILAAEMDVAYIRLDDLPTPDLAELEPYLE